MPRENEVKTLLRWCLILQLAGGLVGGMTLAEDAASEPETQDKPAKPPSIFDNLYLDSAVGAEKPSGESSTPFGLVGANWAIPMTPPDDVAWGLQLGGDLKPRDDGPEWNSTFGGFARNFTTFETQQGAVAALFDYRRTAQDNDLWAFRPIIGTTISSQDALGVEGEASLNQERNQRIADSLTTFWTRGWSERLGTEFGAGYEFSGVKKTLFRARAALWLTQHVDLWIGGDVNWSGSYAAGIGVSYHFGDAGQHAGLHNIGGTGDELYTPFPSADFPSLLQRTKR